MCFSYLQPALFLISKNVLFSMNKDMYHKTERLHFKSDVDLKKAAKIDQSSQFLFTGNLTLQCKLEKERFSFEFRRAFSLVIR